MNQLFNWPPSWSTLFLLPALLVGFTVHELAHAFVAFLLGDTGQLQRNRLSFNPLRHVSWFGLIAFLLVGVGWAKPVQVDASRFRRNPDLGMFLVSVAGAAANVLTGLLVFAGMIVTVALVWVLTGADVTAVFQYLVPVEALRPDLHGIVVSLSYYMVSVNLILAVFNLLPLPPLDGFTMVVSLFTLVRRALKRGAGPQPAPAAVPALPPGLAPASEQPRTPAQIHLDIALTYHRQGQLDEAIARYRQAIGNDERLALAYYNLGLAYWAKGRSSLAAGAFRTANRPGGDPGIRYQAELRLQELAGAGRDVEVEPGSLPPPLEPGDVRDLAGNVVPAPDGRALRRQWVRLGAGAAAMLLFALAAWLLVTLATYAAMMPA